MTAGKVRIGSSPNLFSTWSSCSRRRRRATCSRAAASTAVDLLLADYPRDAARRRRERVSRYRAFSSDRVLRGIAMSEVNCTDY